MLKCIQQSQYLRNKYKNYVKYRKWKHFWWAKVPWMHFYIYLGSFTLYGLCRKKWLKTKLMHIEELLAFLCHCILLKVALVTKSLLITVLITPIFTCKYKKAMLVYALLYSHLTTACDISLLAHMICPFNSGSVY